MTRPALTIAAALLAIGGALLYRRRQAEADAMAAADDGAGGVVDDVAALANSVAENAAEVVDTMTGGGLKLSAMARVTSADLMHPNVQAFLRVIRRGEGTADDAGYRRLFGGQLFAGFADHPRIKVTKGAYTSTAAGAYQALTSSWDETKRIMGLPDFSPPSQDRFAVGRIAARGALDDVIAGRFALAINKCAWEWASLPGSPYGQPTISMATAANVFAANGGAVNA